MDDSGVIENLGVDNIVKIQKTAAIARAESEKEIAKARAMAKKEANDAEVAAQQEIAIKQREAESEAIRMKSLAEAEAMEKKAEAYQKYNNAAMGEMLINVLPEIAGKIAEPLSTIDKVTTIGAGASGVGEMAGNVPAVMAKLFEPMKETVGIDLNEIVRAGTYDAKVNRNLTVNGIPGDLNVNVDSTNEQSAEPPVLVQSMNQGALLKCSAP